MVNLTLRERKALLFIGLLLFSGAVLNFLNKKNPAWISNFYYQETAVKNAKININKATVKDLVKISGLGEVLAGRIIQYRTEHGPFEDVSEIKNVKGIGDKKLENIEKQNEILKQNSEKN